MNEQFDLDAFVDDLRDAAKAPERTKAVRRLIEDAMSDSDLLAASIPDFGDDVILFEDDTVSIWYCHFLPGMSVPPHDHQVSAVIGVFRGQERNDFFEKDPAGTIRKSSEVVLGAGDVLSIGPSAIHSVSCISATPCNGLHVYLGELTKVDRSLFDTETGQTLRFDDDNYNALMRPDT